MNRDWMRAIEAVEPRGETRLWLRWSDGTEAELPLDPTLRANNAELGEWGHSVAFPNGFEIGADSLWADTLTATGRNDAREFLEWRIANSFSLARTAEALGLSRRTVAYYSNGERRVPKAILLACKGWDATHRDRKAA
jgi:hypothetical protein